jgi:hypothetical protein
MRTFDSFIFNIVLALMTRRAVWPLRVDAAAFRVADAPDTKLLSRKAMGATADAAAIVVFPTLHAGL